jgi:hypothetical protein
MPQKKYRETYEAKLLAQGIVCQTPGHEHKPATTTQKTLCFACYSKKRWLEDEAYREAQTKRHSDYVAKNRDKINAIAKKWRDNNPEKHRAAVKKSIAKRKEREQKASDTNE